MLSPGEKLGRYEVVSPLGAGGMGEVYRARDRELQREVALKILPEALSSDPDRVKRFEREAKATAALSHPNVLTVFDVGRQDGRTYLVFEMLEGATLAGVMKGGALRTREALDYAGQVARGLAAAHAHGVVHRDVKPANLFLTTTGTVKILDFGLARIRGRGSESHEETSTEVTAPGHVLGTVSSMSPEQARGEPLDARSDLFSLGVVLYEMLSGRHPFRRTSSAETVSAILRDEPPELGALEGKVPVTVERLARRCLEKRPEDRFQTANDLALALDLLARGEDAGPRPAGKGSAAGSGATAEERPYPGLSSFTEADAGRFFGREDEVAALWEKIQRQRLLAVIGPSGVGKTSFLRAGVLARKPTGWATVYFTPGASPVAALARAVSLAVSSEVARAADQPGLAGELMQGVADFLQHGEPGGLVSVICAWRRPSAEALLVVDQFEELFTLNPSETQKGFAALLGSLVDEGDVHVLLALRDDFLFGCHALRALRAVFQDLTPLGAPSSEALRRTLVEPAARLGVRFEDDPLVGEMVETVQSERGALPLLAFAVSRLWEKRDRERGLLTREAYREIGGVAGALAQHAESTLERVGAARVPLVRELFRNLVTSQRTRVVRERGELLSVFGKGDAPKAVAEAEEVLTTLVDARLLTSYERAEEGGKSHHEVEIIHESLLSAWPRLVRWQTQDADGAQLRDQLRQAAQVWQDRGKPEDLLWSGTAYRDLTLWRERYPGGLTATEEAFAGAARRLAGRKRRTRRIALASLFAAALAVAAVTASLWRQARADALHAEAARLVALGGAEIDRYPTAALAYARKSLELRDAPEARRLVALALWSGPPARILPLPLKGIGTWNAEFSPDGRWLATFPFSETVLLFPDDGGAPVAMGGHKLPDGPPGLAFTTDGRALLTRTPGQSRVRMLKVPEGKEICWLSPDLPGGDARQFAGWARLPQGVLFAVREGGSPAEATHRLDLRTCAGGPPRILGAFVGQSVPWQVDASGSRLVLVRDGRILLRPLAGPPSTPERELGKVTGAGVGWIRFSPRGDAVVVAQGGDQLTLWSLATDADPGLRVFHMAKPDLQFPPELDASGTRLAWGSTAESGVSVWRLDGPADADPIVLRRPAIRAIKGAAFHPGGRFLAVPTTASITLWDVGQPQPYVLRGHEGRIRHVQFTPDSEWLVSCGREDGVRVWPIHPRAGIGRTLGNPVGLCNDFAIAPDGANILVGGAGGAHLLPVSGGEGRRVMERPRDGGLYAVAFDHTGRRAAAAGGYSPTSAPKLLRVFDLPGGALRELALIPPGESGEGYNWGVRDLAFTEGHLISGGDGGVRRFDPESGESHWIWRLEPGRWASFRLSRNGRQLLAAAFPLTPAERLEGDHALVHFDLAAGSQQAITTHGKRVTAVAMDPSGRVFVTGDAEGAVRAGAADGREPHLLLGHQDEVTSVAVSPDGRWIASGAGSEIRLWPMPDVMKTPLHVQPLASLLATLRELTNLEVVEDPASSSGYRLEVGPFPGWKTAPTSP